MVGCDGDAVSVVRPDVFNNTLSTNVLRPKLWSIQPTSCAMRQNRYSLAYAKSVMLGKWLHSSHNSYRFTICDLHSCLLTYFLGAPLHHPQDRQY